MSSLSTSQHLVLATAAARADGAVLPFPDGFRVWGRARQLMLEGMITRGLIASARPEMVNSPGHRALVTLPSRSRWRAALWSDRQTKSHPLETISRPNRPPLGTARTCGI